MINRRDYKARIMVVFIAFVFLYAVIFVRLFLIQVRQKNFFKILAHHQYHVDITIDPFRGEIFDRNGKRVAINREVPSAFILPHQLTTSKETYQFLKECYPYIYKKIKRHPKRKFFWVERKLVPKRLKAFVKKLKKYNVKDIQFINESQRFYPFKELAHVIGFTNIDNEGISGIEQLYSHYLQGSPTKLSLQKDARYKHLYFDKKVREKGSLGSPVTLTIDLTLQFLAFEEVKRVVQHFNAKRGSALIINPDTGEILVMASYPTFNPNEQIPDDLEVTKNHIVTECYEMGSVMKIFTALAALEKGVVEYDELIDSEGKVAYIKGFRVENWKSLGVLPFYDVIRFSSNVGPAKVAHRIGEEFYDYLKNLGFGKKTQVEFLGERSGFVNPPENWSRSSLTVLSFGYEIMTTLLQLGVATSVIANGGYSIKPYLIKNPFPCFMKHSNKKLYKDETIYQMKNILEKSGVRCPVHGYRVMGKTGTARMVKNGKYSRKNHVYTFAGIIEKDLYRRVIITFVEQPEKSYLWASQISAPLFQKIAERMVLHDSTCT